MRNRGILPLDARAYLAPDGVYYSYRERNGRWFVFSFTPLELDFTVLPARQITPQLFTDFGPEEGLSTEIEADSLARRLADAPPADNEEVNRALENWMGSHGVEITFHEPTNEGEPYTAVLDELGISAQAETQEEAFNVLIDALLRFVEDHVFAGKPLPTRRIQSVDGEAVNVNG